MDNFERLKSNLKAKAQMTMGVHIVNFSRNSWPKCSRLNVVYICIYVSMDDHVSLTCGLVYGHDKILHI
jgi:hypothetical protein